MMTINEVADKYGVGARTVRNWIMKGLPTQKEQRGLRYIVKIDLYDLEKFLRDNNLMNKGGE